MIACDISSYQPVVDDTYPHRWLIFRDSDPAYQASAPDPHTAANAAWCRQAVADGRMDGWTTYAVYEPGYNQQVMQYLAALGPVDHVMIDIESWGGQITGDHSGEINQLAEMLATKYGQSNVWGYANRGDLAAVWATHVPWIPLVIASYGGTQPTVPNMVGWQYTNGQYQVAGKPSSSPPFGPCDHNELFITASTPEAFMALTDAQQTEMYTALHDPAGYMRTVLEQYFTGTGKARISQALQDEFLAVSQSIAKLPTADEIATAVLSKLPPAAAGGLTKDDVKTAVKAALAEGVNPAA